MYPGRYARTTPDKPAVIMAGSGEVVTYAELDERSNRLAQVFRAAGLRYGDHVALLAENHPRYYEVYWAAVRSGLYITAVNRHLTAEETEYIVTDSDAKVFVTSARMAETAAAVRSPGALRLMFDGTVPGFDSYEKALAGAPPEPVPERRRGSPMLYSSGTTGRPKGIEQPLSGLDIDDPALTMGSAISTMYGFDDDTVYLSPAPLYHSAPLAYSTAAQALGGTTVVLERFDAEAALAAIERYRVTHSQWVPTMFVRMLRLPEGTRAKYDVSTLRKAIHAAAPCPVEVKRSMIEWWGPVIEEYYASTESFGSTHIGSEDWLRKPGSVGRAMNGTLHICDDDGSDLPAGQIGTVYFEQPQIVFQYHNAPDKTDDSRHPAHANWASVGDVGYVDDEGFLFLTDRSADLIISGGVNIYPREIEDCLFPHPEVADVAVIGVPNQEMGESVLAVVQPADGVEPGDDLAERLEAYAREHIAGYKIPRAFEFVAEMPRTPVGKLNKRALRAAHR
jgi:fatty-acyl-CoA synthase